MPAKSKADRRLVIVESPAKAKTIQGYLGPEYDVEASVGHIRDLAKSSEMPESVRKEPWASLAVDVDHDYEPYYVVHASKKQKVAELKRKLAGATEVLLATDEDREGEAISWHLLEVLKPTVPVRRMVFNEITRDAIRDAAVNTRELDMRLVDAQETRRIVDRLYGFQVSGVLWRKIGASAKSAGRVQSVAVRLVVERERERIAFRSASYADVRGEFEPGGFAATLSTVDGVRVASGKDFDDRGQLTATAVLHLDEAAATTIADGLRDASFVVRSVQEKPGTRRPSAPFMTSTLQQEASRAFGWNARRTMQVAQRLYENGHITYMRTDSTTLSGTAVDAARRQATELFGADHVSEVPRRYDRKVKNAQEAHEAIRPSGDTFLAPGELAGRLESEEFRLYELIWRRTLASQMVDARISTTTLRFGAVTTDGRDAEFSASGTVVKFAGYKAAYSETVEDDSREGDDAERRLPAVVQGDRVSARSLSAEPHATRPPARYTEASLVSTLEELGIGRPSTYASIMSTIVDRGYVWKKGAALVPSWTAFAVNRLLEEHFTELVDYAFTARMEEVLDSVSNGESSRLAALEGFYRGEGRADFPGLVALLDESGEIDARAISAFPVEGTDAVLRVGRYGPYLDRDGVKANVPDDLAPDEIDPAKVEELFARPTGDYELGTDPESGRAIVAKDGRYGPYVTEVLGEDVKTTGKNAVKPRTASLFKTMTLDTVTLADALRLLSQPRTVGADPADGVDITTQNGRYGPYLTKAGDSRSLESEEQIFTLTLDEALAKLAQPKQRRGQAAAAAVLKELGDDPVSGTPVTLREGRFGPYVTDGEVNASLRRDDDPATITPVRAAELLADKRARGPAPKKRAAKKAPAKKATAKKATAKKTTAKKTTAKKSAAKKDAAKPAATTVAAPVTTPEAASGQTTAPPV